MELFYCQYGECSAHHSVDLAPKEADFPLHAHPFCEVFYFIKGSGYYTVEGRDYPLSPHDILLMRDGEIHKLHIDENTPYERMAIHFPLDEILGKSTPFAGLRALFLDRTPGCDNRFSAHSADSAAFLRSCFNRICCEGQTAEEFALSLTSFLPALLSELYRTGAHTPLSVSPPKREHAELLPEIIDYINRHLTEIEGLSELEHRFFFSKSTLNRLFTESTGSTVWEYVVLKRLHAARRMLLDGKSAALAAAASGFGDYSAFYRQYKRVFGESPRRERKSDKNGEKS